MARLEDIPQPTRDNVAALECSSLDARPFVSGPLLAQRRVAILSSAALFPRSGVPLEPGSAGFRDLEAQGGGDEGDFGLLFSPIVCMKREHRFIDDIFTELRTLTDGFTAPAWASERHRALLADLDRFERDTFEHVHRENDELFPLANDLVPAVR